NDGEHHIGFYLSALINKIIQPDDVITLNITEEVDGLGTKLQHGTLIVNGDVGDDVGHAMAGGKLIVKGNIASSVGYCMEGGEIHINGCMEDFQEDSILKGKLYHRGKLIVSK
ncbi:MAG: hypothetical protein KKA79_08130, partial [Nanoarchaeota archaeon]|nr:hypothetical protein [Nanoarchaeota archaeon]